MCMIEDVDKLLVLSDVTRKAAKSHRCCECGRGIERGEQYRYETGVSDGRVVTHKTCAHCLIVREWLSGECGGWVYTMTEEDLVEHCNGYGHPMSVYRLAVGQRRRWRTRKGALMPLPTCPPTTHERAVRHGANMPLAA